MISASELLHRRSAVNFVIFLIVVVGVTLYLLQKAQEAVDEINHLQNMPTIVERRAALNTAPLPAAQ